jgi:hypothetical protein
MFFNWQIQPLTDQTSPMGSTVSLTCSPGVSISFSGPVMIQSVNVFGGQDAGIVGKKGGTQVWAYQGSGSPVWMTVTNGGNVAVDEIDFPASWNGRYTDFFIQDAAALTEAPLLTTFGMTPNPQLRAAGTPVKLNWIVRPTATVTVDNGIGDVTAYTSDGVGIYAVAPTSTTTYTLIAQDGEDSATSQVTVAGSTLPDTVGFLTFEDRSVGNLDSLYTWNTPAGVYLTWTDWAVFGDSVGGPSTPNSIYPLQFTLSSTNSIGETNNATLLFTDSSGLTPVPVMVNSFAVAIDTNNFVPPPVGWGPLRVEGRLAGVVQWTFDGSEAVQGENIVVKGSGIPIDEMDFSGQWYHYDNFALSTVSIPAAPAIQQPTAQDGLFQFAWNPVTDWADYVVYKKTTLADPWSRVGVVLPVPHGSTNTYSEPINGSGFYRILRVP